MVQNEPQLVFITFYQNCNISQISNILEIGLCINYHTIKASQNIVKLRIIYYGEWLYNSLLVIKNTDILT